MCSWRHSWLFDCACARLRQQSLKRKANSSFLQLGKCRIGLEMFHCYQLQSSSIAFCSGSARADLTARGKTYRCLNGCLERGVSVMLDALASLLERAQVHRPITRLVLQSRAHNQAGAVLLSNPPNKRFRNNSHRTCIPTFQASSLTCAASELLFIQKTLH